MGLYAGKASLVVGGMDAKIFKVSQGDVIFFPAGISHRKMSATPDFQTIGAYPFHIKYDMNYLKVKEFAAAMKIIPKVKLPLTDPIYGKQGKLFEYWK